MAIKSLSVLATVGVESESGYGVFHIDMAEGRVFKSDGTIAPPELSREIVANIRGQQEAMMPEIPYEQIYEVMSTEKSLAEENNKHIFRR